MSSISLLDERQADGGAGAFAVFAVDKLNFAAVGAGDLLGQRQADAAARRLGGIEGDEQVLCIRDAQAAILDGDEQGSARPLSNRHAPAANPWPAKRQRRWQAG